MMRKITVASTAFLLALLFAAPAFAQPPTNSTIVMTGTPYNNVFLWFGLSTFADNVPFGTWSNCPFGSTTVSTPLCSSTALTNANWDSNNVGYVGNCGSGFSSWCLVRQNNELIMNASFIEPLLCSVGQSCFSSPPPYASGQITFHRESGDRWVAVSSHANRFVLSLTPGGTPYSYVYESGTLQFSGTPSASTFVSGTIDQWSYVTPAAYGTFQSFLPNAVYVRSMHLYLDMTSVISLSGTQLTPSGLTSLIQSTPYLGQSPFPSGFA